MQDSATDTLRLSPSDVSELMIAHEPGEPTASSARETHRWAMQNQQAMVTFIEEGNVRRTVSVLPRDLSVNGISFFHGGFLHEGTRCVVSLRTMHGKAKPLKGTVMRCNHRKGRIHEIGVKLDERIKPRDYFIKLGDKPFFNAEAVDLASLRGTMLVVSNSGAERRLIADYFKGSNIICVESDSAESVLERIKAEPVDLIFADADLSGSDYMDFIEALRDAAFSGPIVMMSGVIDSDRRLASIVAGAAEMIFKPVDSSILHRAAAEYLSPSSDSSSGLQPMFSTLGSSEDLREAIGEYVGELQDTAVMIHQAVRSQDHDELDRIYRHLFATGAQFGFPPITETAEQAIKSLEDAPGSSSIKLKANDLIKLCRRAEAGDVVDPYAPDEG